MSDGVTFAKEICNGLGIVIEHQHQPKKKRQMLGEGSEDAQLPYETETVFFAGQTDPRSSFEISTDS